MIKVTQLRPSCRLALRCRPALRWVCLILSVASALSLKATWAQAPAEAKPAAHEHVVPETPEFKAATEALREHLRQMRVVMVRFNTTLPNLPQDRQLREQWFEMLSQGAPIFQRMMAAAVAEYQLSPSPTNPLAAMLWETFKHRVDADMYEGMLSVGQALVASGYEDPELRSLTMRTAFAMNDFETVRKETARLTGEQENSPEVQRSQEEIDKLKALWDEELAAREQDAQGIPLPRVRMKTTKGNIEIELFENQAPETVANFISLVESGFYDGLTFHRVIEHFMAQTGCPIGDGTGGPDYHIYGEADKPNARNFFRGTVGMALSGAPNSGGSQFFITFLPAVNLNGSYTAFGRVTEGIEVLGHIVRVDPDSADDQKKKPDQPLDEIISIEVLTKREHDYKPHKVE